MSDNKENSTTVECVTVDICTTPAIQEPSVEVPGHSGLGTKKRKSKGKSKLPKKRKAIPKLSSDEEYSTSSSSESSSESSDSEGDSVDSDQSVYGHFDPVDKKIIHKIPRNLDKFVKKYFTTYLNPDAMAKVKEDWPTPSSSAFNIPKLDED